MAIAERDRRTAEYHGQFERLRSGGPTDADIMDIQRRTYQARKTGPREPISTTFKIDEAAIPTQVMEFLVDYAIEQHAAKDLEAAEKLLGVKFDTATRRKIGLAILDASVRGGGSGMTLDEPLRRALGADAPPPFLSSADGEKFSEAFEAHVTELERAGTRATTITSYRQMAGAFQEWCKDAPIASITRAMASDFLVELGGTRSNATVNQYAALLAAVFETARKRGRFAGDNGFKDQKRRAEVQSYEAFTGAELGKLFAAATFEVKPKTHTTATALPWAALIAAFSGLRREEIAQLRWQDLREIDGVWAFDVTPEAGKLKTKSSPRVVPVHSTLISQGLLKYHANLPQGGRLFPGLKARVSKGGKLGAGLGDAFEAWRKTVGLVRDGLTFHSFRHGVAEALDRAGVAETDAARILGHDIPGMSFGTYSSGPGLKRLQAEVEKIEFPGLHWL